MSNEYLREGNIVIRKSTPDDILYLEDKLRHEDIREAWASYRYRPHEALFFSYVLSGQCFTYSYKDEPVAMFGTSDSEMGVNIGSIWLLGSDMIDKVFKSFAKHSKVMINYLIQPYEQLVNFVDVRNEKTIRWLKWCGAEFSDPVPWGKDQLPFRFFVIRRDAVCVPR